MGLGILGHIFLPGTALDPYANNKQEKRIAWCKKCDMPIYSKNGNKRYTCDHGGKLKEG